MDLEALQGAKIEGNLKDLNDILFFDIIGELGIPCCWRERESIFHLSYILTIFSLACSIFCIISVGGTESIISSTNWSFGESDSSRMWVGLSGTLWETIVGATTVKAYIDWTDEACSDTPDNPYCDNCDTGGQASVFLVLLSCATRLPSIMLLNARMNPISDIPLIKFLGMVSEGMAAMCLSGAMFIWREYCHVQLPKGSMTYGYGSGFYLLSAGFCVTFLLFFIHLLMPTEDPYDDVSLLDEHLACCSAKARAAVEREKAKKNGKIRAQGAPGDDNTKKKKRRRKKKKVVPEIAPPEPNVMERKDVDVELGGTSGERRTII